jgi:hypothetical protein
MYRLLAAGLRYPGLGTLTPEQNPDVQRQFYREQVRTPPQLKLCFGKKLSLYYRHVVGFGQKAWKLRL